MAKSNSPQIGLKVNQASDSPLFPHQLFEEEIQDALINDRLITMALINQSSKCATNSKKIPMPQELSAFERLPTEILQEIFFYSRNFNLPGVSPCLYLSLTCDHVKKRFLCAAFAMDGVFRELVRTCPDLTFDEEEEMGRFQGKLMGLKWFSYDFLSKCHKEFLWGEFKKIVNYLVDTYPEVRHDRGKLTSDLEVFLESAWNMTMNPVSGLVVDYSPSPDGPSLNVRANVDSLSGSAATRYSYPPRIYITLKDYGDSDDVSTLAVINGGGHERLANSVNLYTPDVSIYLVVPNRLLRSPWTEDKLRLLMWISNDFLEFSTCGDEPFTAECDVKAASQGLEDAIREYCVPAMVLLARPSGAYWYKDFMAEIEHLIRPLGSGNLDLGDDHFNSGIQIHTDLLANGFMALSTVAIRDKHLIAALEAAERHGDIEAKVFRWLLPLAVLWEYDKSYGYTVPENQSDPFLLIKWAIAKQAEELQRGIKDGFGSLALKSLHEEQQRMKTVLKEMFMDEGRF